MLHKNRSMGGTKDLHIKTHTIFLLNSLLLPKKNFFVMTFKTVAMVKSYTVTRSSDTQGGHYGGVLRNGGCFCT